MNLEETIRTFIDNMAHIDLFNKDTRRVCADDLIRRIKEKEMKYDFDFYEQQAIMNGETLPEDIISYAQTV